MMTGLYRLAIWAIVLLSLPLQILIALLIVLSSGSPVLFRQRRVCKDGRVFTMYKFRTMRKGAEHERDNLASQNESDGPTFKIHHDPRFTEVGKFLSHTGLDELPQLVNVLCGDMALIGPRPLPLSEAKLLKPWMRKRHRINPGMISPAIIDDAYHDDFVAWMKSDVAYARNKHMWGDVLLVFRFVPFMARMLLRELVGR